MVGVEVMRGDAKKVSCTATFACAPSPTRPMHSGRRCPKLKLGLKAGGLEGQTTSQIIQIGWRYLWLGRTKFRADRSTLPWNPALRTSLECGPNRHPAGVESALPC